MAPSKPCSFPPDGLVEKAYDTAMCPTPLQPRKAELSKEARELLDKTQDIPSYSLS